MEKTKNSGDMTKGKPLKLILIFAIPLFIGNIFQQLYNMADSVIVGRTIGVQALAAVGSTGSITFLVMGLIQGLSGGFAVMTAQRFGAGDYDRVKKSIAISIVLSFALSVVITLISVFAAKPLLKLMQTPDDILDAAAFYTVVIFSGSIALMFYNVFANIIRAFGDSKTPLIFLIIASIINIGLDLLFIIAFRMGVEGAAFATIIAQGISAILCMFYMRIKYKHLMPSKKDFKIDMKDAVKHIKVGLPMGFQFMIIALGIIILQVVLNSFGSTVIAAFTAASKVDQLVTQMLVAMGLAMATYSAQNYGAGKIDRIKEGVKWGVVISVVMSVIGFLLLFFFGGNICKLFIESDSQEEIATVLQYASTYLKTVSIFYPVLCLIFIFRNTIQGMGNAVVAMIAGIAELLLRGLGAVFMASWFGFVGVCLAGPAAWFGAVAVLIPSYIILIKKHMRALFKHRAETEEDFVENPSDNKQL